MHISKCLKSEKGMTLVEIIVALTIFAILIIGVLSIYRFTSIQIYNSGVRTQKVQLARSLADDLVAYDDIQEFSSSVEIQTYLSGKGYHLCSVFDDLKTKYDNIGINYYVSNECYKSNVLGYEVTFNVFLNGNDYVSISAFVIKGGGIK